MPREEPNDSRSRPAHDAPEARTSREVRIEQLLPARSSDEAAEAYSRELRDRGPYSTAKRICNRSDWAISFRSPERRFSFKPYVPLTETPSKTSAGMR